MARERQPADTMIVLGEGSTPAEAARAVLAASMPVLIGGPARPGDHTAIVRASAPTLAALVPDFIAATLAAGDDLGIDLTEATLDGLIATDDGWRAWGTVSGEPSSGPAADTWCVDNVVIDETDDTVVMRLELRREPTGG